MTDNSTKKAKQGRAASMKHAVRQTFQKVYSITISSTEAKPLSSRLFHSARSFKSEAGYVAKGIKAVSVSATLEGSNAMASSGRNRVVDGIYWDSVFNEFRFKELKSGRKKLKELLNSAQPESQTSFGFCTGLYGFPKNSCLVSKTEADEKNGLKSIGCGQDAMYADMYFLAVADGVGGSKRLPKSDPALYSQHLIHNIVIQVNSERKSAVKDLEVLIKNSHDKVITEMEISGNSTVLIAFIDKNILRIANLGDCTLILIRGGKAVYRTTAMQHFFNCPYQIGRYSHDTWRDAEVSEVKVEGGDIIILGSDGLFDNLFDSQIIKIACQESIRHPDNIAKDLATKARRLSGRGNYHSPFEKQAKKIGKKFPGGKIDDISVIVAYVLPLPEG